LGDVGGGEAAAAEAGGNGAGGGNGDGANGEETAAAAGGGGAEGNTASDVGVTPNSIKVGNITSRGSALGADQFDPFYLGANAYFALRNAQGGIHGRAVDYVTCDDAGDRSQNIQCAQRLIEREEVFALVGNASMSYAAGDYVSDQGVPDIGGMPIGNAYWSYPTLFAILGAPYERDGTPGDDGTLWYHTGMQHWFAENLGVTKAAVFYYSNPESKQFGQVAVRAAEAHGMDVVEYEVNPAMPNFDSRVNDMEARGVAAIFDAMDVNANQSLCRSMDRRGFQVKAKVSTSAAWSQAVADTFPETCRQSMYMSGYFLPIAETDNPEVARFRETMQRVYGGRYEGRLHQWSFKGWLAAKWFADGVERMGGDVTRNGLIQWLNTLDSDYDFDSEGVAVGFDGFQPMNWSNPPAESCIGIAKWDEGQRDFANVTGSGHCPAAEWLDYQPMS
jgi:branched-chain amino acid transport system substrate-binding protein